MRRQVLSLLRGSGAAALETATVQSLAAPAAALQRLAGVSTSSTSRMALAEVAVDGDLGATISQIDAVLSSDSVSGKEVSDAAVSLAYLQAKGDRRIWGKVFERASAVKSTFDATSLSSFLWAASTAGVDHFKTVAEMSGPASELLSSLSPSQLSLVVEALGKSCVKDVDLYTRAGAKVTQDLAKFKPSEVARLLWGFAAAHHEDGALAKTLSKALVDKAGELTSKEAIQAIWALARLRRTDKPTIDALVKAARGKLGSIESPVDAAALAWSLGFLNYKDQATASALGAALKSGAADLTPAQAIDAAWGLAIMGDKEAAPALFAVATAAIKKDPTSVDAYHLGALYNAAVMTPGNNLPEEVKAYALKMYNLGGESMALKRGGAASAFVKDLSEAVARALGARYRPDIAKAIKGYAITAPGGVAIDIAASVEGLKIAVEPVYPGYTSVTHPGVLLGPAAARAALLEAAGYKVVSIPLTEFLAQGPDPKARASYVLGAIKAAGGKVDALQKKLAEPFNAYAE